MDLLAELRRRLDVEAEHVPDEVLSHFLAVSTGLVDSHVPSHNRAGALYDEAILQLAVKVSEISGRGTIAVDPSGEFLAPSPSATAGLVRSVWAYIAPIAHIGIA